jgi:hypothetical protein
MIEDEVAPMCASAVRGPLFAPTASRLPSSACSSSQFHFWPHLGWPVKKYSTMGHWAESDTYLRVNGVRACFSYRQCRRYFTHKSHVGKARLHRALRLRHSLQACSEAPKSRSRNGSAYPAPPSWGSSDEAASELAGLTDCSIMHHANKSANPTAWLIVKGRG